MNLTSSRYAGRRGSVQPRLSLSRTFSFANLKLTFSNTKIPVSRQARIDSLCYEPQLSIPDAILWIFTGDKRTAYLRVPVADIMFHEDRTRRSLNFGRVQTW